MTEFYVAGIIETTCDKFGINVSCEGMDADMCKGLVISSQQTVTQFLTKHKGIYNYLLLDDVIDGIPVIRAVRRAVNDDLEIDTTVRQRDCIVQGNNPAIRFKRVDPMTLPRSVELQYISFDRGYAVNTQYAFNEGAKTQQGILSVQSDFILPDATARTLAYDLLFRMWQQQLSVAFEHPDLTIEPADIVQVTTDIGTYVIQVLTSMITKEPMSASGLGRTNQLSGQLLLTRKGVSINPGQAGTSSSANSYFHVYNTPTIHGIGNGGAAEFGLSARPFTDASPWNTPVPGGATYTTLAWPAPTGGPLFGIPNSGYNYSIWWDSFSVAIHFTDPSYPLVAIAVPASWGYPADTIHLNIAAGVTGSPDTDAHLLVIDSTTFEVWDFWIFNRTSNTTATADAYGHCNVLTDNGWGTASPFLGAGTLAVGASLLGGLLVQAETDDGVIDHALGLICDDVNIIPGYVSPAIAGDGPSPGGIVQEGEWLAIPPGTTMPTGLPPLWQKIFTALQTYGCYVVDKSGGVNGFRFQSNAYDSATLGGDDFWPHSGRIVPLLKKVN